MQFFCSPADRAIIDTIGLLSVARVALVKFLGDISARLFLAASPVDSQAKPLQSVFHLYSRLPEHEHDQRQPQRPESAYASLQSLW